MDGLSRKLEWALAHLGGRQHGIVTRQQLLALGFSQTMIDARIRGGRLHVVHRGVYLVGHTAEPPLARECAAVLACAPKAMLGRRTAARIWGTRYRREESLEVVVVGRKQRCLPGVRVLTLSSLHPTELRRHHGLPITSPSFTVLDIAGNESQKEFRAVLNEARIKRLVTDASLLATLERHPTRAGARTLRAELGRGLGDLVTESEAEARCLELMIAHDLRPDATQAKIGRYRVDFLYRAERLIVEVDGFAYHSSRDRFIADRRRRADLMARGYEVFPVTWPDLIEQPEATMNRLRLTLERRRALAY